MLTPANPVRAKHPKPAHVQQGVMHGTPATRQIHAIALAGAPSGTTRKRRSTAGGKKKAASSSRPKKAARSARAARSGKAHLVKGSPAAKKRMAQLRAMVGTKKAA